jgi:hypothetical protein
MATAATPTIEAGTDVAELKASHTSKGERYLGSVRKYGSTNLLAKIARGLSNLGCLLTTDDFDGRTYLFAAPMFKEVADNMPDVSRFMIEEEAA